ncbi:uncharacterized protein LOC121727134 [Aricia agestis]|uniref:uncharacterized protein LOC121727134 n=1 Tax=Aricia agestis TaxID=91739 RepID=UPI001C20B460|nr:uncharacterized protein LOC121727134 [Aricia agestis]
MEAENRTETEPSELPCTIPGPDTADVDADHGPNACVNMAASQQLQCGNVPPEFYLHMMTMMQNMSERLTKQREKVKITDVFLPSYDPDGNVGVREWCDHITSAKNNYELSDYDIRMKVTSLLKGRAKMWADNWLVTTSTWDELRQNIITTFEPESRYSKDVLRFREHEYDHTKDIAEFLSRSWILWRRVTKDKLNDNDAVEAVIGTISDERLRIELMNARATSVPELISVASSIRTSKRPNHANVNQPLAKRFKYSLDNRNISNCNFCKKPGHFSRDCRGKNNSTILDKQPVPNNPSSSGISLQKPNTSKICSFCSKAGHTFDTCYRREKQITSNVNSVVINKPKLNTMRMRVGDIVIDAVFDSGADCSVMCESIADRLPGKRVQVVNYLRGIGPFPVVSTNKLTTICVINDINVEIDFYILSDYEMTSDVLIGANLLNSTGLSVIVTENSASLCFQPRVMHIQSSTGLFDNINHDLVNELEINQLLTLLNKYSSIFTRGFPQSRVNTGKLEIRLKNSNKFVERRPYRLSPVEREKVKEIVKELIDNDIVQESKSPYSSPIILVKKKNGDDRMCVDYRELNSNTVRDHYPLPLIADQIDQLTGGQYYTSLDMASGFHQIPIADESIEKTAFVTPDGLFEYKTMPFGLCNAVVRIKFIMIA